MTFAQSDELNVSDQRAEGSSKRESYEDGDLYSTGYMPQISTRRPFDRAAETGIIAAVSLLNEEQDMTDRQDASRHPDENLDPHTRSQSPLILIVEDAIELAEIMQATLERINMKTNHHTHGERALASLDKIMPDVILLDIALPDITGWRFLDELKLRYDHPQSPIKMPPVVVITALGDPANRLVGKLQGVHSYLIKPIKPDELEVTVRSALNSRG